MNYFLDIFYEQPPIYDNDDIWSRLGVPGVAVGLSVSQAGGNVMMVEASKMEGDGEIVLTGQLGNVMQESAHLALNWVRTASREVFPLNLFTDLLLNQSNVNFQMIFLPFSVWSETGW